MEGQGGDGQTEGGKRCTQPCFSEIKTYTVNYAHSDRSHVDRVTAVAGECADGGWTGATVELLVFQEVLTEDAGGCVVPLVVLVLLRVLGES